MVQWNIWSEPNKKKVGSRMPKPVFTLPNRQQYALHRVSLPNYSVRGNESRYDYSQENEWVCNGAHSE